MSGLLTSPREKNKSKFPYFSPWASQRTGAVPYFRLSLSNFGGRGRKATARNTCGLLGYSSAGQTTWVPEFFFLVCWDRVRRRCFRVGRTDSSSAEGRSRERRSARVTVKTWQKPETAYEKSLSPRQRTNGFKLWNLSILGRPFTESKATCNVYSKEQQQWSHFRISGPQTPKSEKPCTT